MTVIYYADPGYWVDGYAVDKVVGAAPQAVTTVQQLIPSYLYWQYNDDTDLQAFVDSYNSLCQQILNTLNQINLPVYAGNDLVSGALLDWVALGIYGQPRPILSSGSVKSKGTYNSVPYNVVPYNTEQNFGAVVNIETTDDVFKRILTWNLYKGDGRIFSVSWLKRRVMRFLDGVDGTDPGVTTTYPVGVTFSGLQNVTIDVSGYVAAQPSSPMPAILQAAVATGAVQLPFQYNFTVVV